MALSAVYDTMPFYSDIHALIFFFKPIYRFFFKKATASQVEKNVTHLVEIIYIIY